MKEYSAIALFCEDIREEAGDTDTVIGIMPDNILVPAVPSGFTKLCIYVRLLMSLELTPKTIELFLKFPDGSERPLGAMTTEETEVAFDQAREKNSSAVGLILRVRMVGVPIKEEGKLVVILRSALGERVCGSLNIQKQT